uniref:Uncharacterized protein n=1 Tax=Ditylenchus dipsaci TaxID=166011 RepID=A0A915DP14_9BILA
MRKRTSTDTGQRRSNASKTLPIGQNLHQLGLQPFYHSKSSSGDAKASPLLPSLGHLKRQSFRKSKNYKPVEEADEPKSYLEDGGLNPFRPHITGPRHSNPFKGNRMSQDFNPFRDVGKVVVVDTRQSTDSGANNPFRDGVIPSTSRASDSLAEDPFMRKGMHLTKF